MKRNNKPHDSDVSRAHLSLTDRCPQIYLYPGRLFATSKPHAVTTVLGSCVAVCLWDPRRRTAGINHFLLPACPSDEDPSERFGTVAVERLLGKVLGLGSAKSDLVAKLFGGAHVIGTAEVPDRGQLGARNEEQARQLLADHGIPVVAEDVGGSRGRKLIFHTADGSVQVKKL